MQVSQPQAGPTAGPRNYVFVDEHNRHKRLKVMRACEGCRRRKIKCDAATTNTWPCGACRRLKLPCVPPAGGIEGDQVNDQSDVNASSEPSAGAPQYQAQFEEYPAQYQHAEIQQQDLSNNDHYGIHQAQNMYQIQEYAHMQNSNMRHGSFQGSYPANDRHYSPVDASISYASASSPGLSDEHTAEMLMDQLGRLKISVTGVAPYTRQQEVSNIEPEAPIQENEIEVPRLSTKAGSQIRIPPTLMPSEEDAAASFELFFTHVHPYTPVICRDPFLYQWKHNRSSLSPLLLESIFACAARMSGEPVGDSAWLALANQHERLFLDTPRLSTVQALLLLLKAREGSPKRGYFYKSWMTCKTMISMAKDLELHEHFATHEVGESCGFSPVECLSRTRTWQCLLICEMMIGGTQGRTDFGVDLDTVEYGISPPHSNMNQYEAKITRQYAFFTRNARNIRGILGTYMKIKKKKDWALDPAFVSHNQAFKSWPSELPPDLQVQVSLDGPIPQLDSHFIGNLHSHHQLGIILTHRPQLLALKSSPNEQQWKPVFEICYNAAKTICQLQDAILTQHQITGLLSMLRGMSFTVYTVLTCIMLHMVAITSPDPTINADARQYFVRHMRLLEQCIQEWPMPETEEQINNLRAAFSADLSKPFDLKPSFPYGSPSDSHSTIRRSSESVSQFDSPHQQPGYLPQQNWQQDISHFPTPPISNGADGSQPRTPSLYQDYTMTQTHPQYQNSGPISYPSNTMPTDQVWDPAPIIDHFNQAFAIPPSALAPPSASSFGSPPLANGGQSLPQQPYSASPQTPSFDQNPFSRQPSHQMQAQMGSQMTHRPDHNQYYDSNIQPQPHSRHAMMQPQYSTDYISAVPPQRQNSTSMGQPQPAGVVYVTPKQWQQSVASVYDPSGMKRKWQSELPLGLS